LQRAISQGYIQLYAAPNFLKNGDQIPKFVVFEIISTIKDEKSAAKFHYITRTHQEMIFYNIAHVEASAYAH